MHDSYFLSKDVFNAAKQRASVFEGRLLVNTQQVSTLSREAESDLEINYSAASIIVH